MHLFENIFLSCSFQFSCWGSCTLQLKKSCFYRHLNFYFSLKKLVLFWTLLHVFIEILWVPLSISVFIFCLHTLPSANFSYFLFFLCLSFFEFFHAFFTCFWPLGHLFCSKAPFKNAWWGGSACKLLKSHSVHGHIG